MDWVINPEAQALEMLNSWVEVCVVNLKVAVLNMDSLVLYANTNKVFAINALMYT